MVAVALRQLLLLPCPLAAAAFATMPRIRPLLLVQQVVLVLLLLMAVLSMLVVAGWFGRSGWMEWGVSSGSFEFLAMHAWAG